MTSLAAAEYGRRGSGSGSTDEPAALRGYPVAGPAGPARPLSSGRTYDPLLRADAGGGTLKASSALRLCPTVVRARANVIGGDQ